MNLDDVIKYFGSVHQITKRLGVTHQAVYAWKRTGVPPMRQYHIEAVTYGALRAERPKADAA